MKKIHSCEAITVNCCFAVLNFSQFDKVEVEYLKKNSIASEEIT